MRILIFFDLPTTSIKERKAYTLFRKKLLAMGFSMIQYSMYSKIALNHSQAEIIEKNIKLISPKLGDISVLTLTENQFQTMKWIRGKTKSDVLQTFDRLVIV